MCQSSSDRRLSGSGRAREQHSPLRLEAKLLGDIGLLEWQNDIRLEGLEDVVQPLEVLQIHNLHLAEVHVARHVVLAEVVDEPVRIEPRIVTQGIACVSQLPRVQVGREAMDLLHIQRASALSGEIRCAQHRVIVHYKRGNMRGRYALVDPRNGNALRAEYEPFPRLGRHLDDGHEGGRQKVEPRVSVRAAGHNRDEMEIVHDDRIVDGERLAQHRIHRFVECQRVTVGGSLHEMLGREIRPADPLVQYAKNGRFAGARAPHERCDMVSAQVAFELLERLVLGWEQFRIGQHERSYVRSPGR